MIECPCEGCRRQTSDGLPCNTCILRMCSHLDLAAPVARELRAAPGHQIHPRDLNLPPEQQRIIEAWPAGTFGSRHQPWEDSGDVWAGLDAELETTITRQTSKTPQPGGRSNETVVPFNTNASDAHTELLRVLRYWTSVLAPDASPPQRVIAGMLAPNIRAHAHWIITNRHTVRTNEAGPDIVDDIVRAVQDAIAAVDARAGRLFAGRCDNCGTDLFIRQGDDDAHCRACDTITGGRERWRFERHATTADQLVEQGLILKALPLVGESEVTKQRLNNWLRRGKLQPAYRVWLSKDPDPRPPVYRIADVVRLAQPRKAAA